MNRLDSFTHNVSVRVLSVDKIHSAHSKMKRYKRHLDHTATYTLTDLSDEGLERMKHWMGSRVTQLGALQKEVDCSIDQSFRFIAQIDVEQQRRQNGQVS